MDMEKRKAPSLLDLSVKTAIDNVRYLGDVGETDIDLLRKILPHCTIDQLMHIEYSTKGRDMSEVTNELWRKFFQKEFGLQCATSVIKNQKARKVSFKWRILYQAKLKQREEDLQRSVSRMKKLQEEELARKQTRQVQICTKVPPSSKRPFWGGSCSSYNVGNLKSNLMKKSRIECVNSREVQNIAAMKKNAIQKSHSVSHLVRAAIPRKDAAASSCKAFKPSGKRF